jgi:hypothetical protein
MDFILGILLVAIIILMMFNFTSISISNTPNTGNCNNNQNYLISSMQQSMPQLNINGMNIPQSNYAGTSSVNASILPNQPVYDYGKYFFVK